MKLNFAENIRKLRRENGLTQEQLAEQLFVSRTAVSKWESGRGYPNIESLKAIAKFFSVSVDELLSGNDPVFNASSTNTVLLQRFNALSKSNQALILNIIDALSASKKQ